MTREIEIPCKTLYRMRVDEGMTFEEMAKDLGCGSSTVQRRCEECGTPARSGASTSQIRQLIQIDKSLLYQLYVKEEKTEKEIGANVGRDHRTVRRCLIAHNVPLRKKLQGAHITKSVLERLYEHDGRSIVSIAREYKCSRVRVDKLLKQYGIETHNQSLQRRLSKDVLTEMYIEKNISITRIAEKMGCSEASVRTRLRKYGIPIHERRSIEHLERAGHLKKEGKARQEEMWHMLGGRCHVCGRGEVALHIHHMCYMPNDVIHENYAQAYLYHVELYPIVKNEKWRFRLLCGSCHMVMGTLGSSPTENISRLMDVVTSMDSMRGIHATRHADLVLNDAGKEALARRHRNPYA